MKNESKKLDFTKSTFKMKFIIWLTIAGCSVCFFQPTHILHLFVVVLEFRRNR